jgi:hypothetical protein
MNTPSKQSAANALKQLVSGVGLIAVKVRLGNMVEPVPGTGTTRLPVAADANPAAPAPAPARVRGAVF